MIKISIENFTNILHKIHNLQHTYATRHSCLKSLVVRLFVWLSVRFALSTSVSILVSKLIVTSERGEGREEEERGARGEGRGEGRRRYGREMGER